MDSDDLSQLMPNIQQRAQQSSPDNTLALREYIRVLGEKKNNVPATSTVPHKPRTGGLQLRAGSGRRPQRRHFIIKIRADELESQDCEQLEEEQQVELDPESLKDALLEQAKAARHALLEAALRPGTGWVPQHREFAITLSPLPLEEEEEEEELGEGQQQELYEEGVYGEVLESGAPGELLGEDDVGLEQYGEAEGQAELLQHVEQLDQQQEWETEEGVLAEQQAQPQLQPADASPAAAATTAATPGTALRQQGGQQSIEEQQQADSQLAQARTPATALLGRYTPMEGVPERLLLLASRAKKASTTSYSGRAVPAGTPAGFTPLEGIPERLMAFQPLAGGPRPLGLPGATRICSNEEQQSVDSPVEGLVQHGAWRGTSGGAAAAAQQLQPADAGGFAFVPLPQQEAWGDDDNSDAGGTADDAGEEPALAGRASSPRGLPVLACRSPPRMAEAGVQTGCSLDDGGEDGAEQEAAAAGGVAMAAAEEEMQDDGYGGYDAAGDYGDEQQQGQQQGQQQDADGYADLPESSLAAAQRARHRQTRNPGMRLRNELKRKSLTADPRVGRHEVLPGVRRSARSRQEPLKWWLNEKKEFGRQHKTMPTVNHVVHKVPNTPWQTVTDIVRRPAKKKRAPTPHDIEGDLAAAADDDDDEEEASEQDEEQQQREEEAAQELEAEQQQQQQGRRGAAPAQRQPAPRQPAANRPACVAAKAPLGRATAAKKAAAKAPPPKAAATKKAAGSKRRTRR